MPNASSDQDLDLGLHVGAHLHGRSLSRRRSKRPPAGRSHCSGQEARSAAEFSSLPVLALALPVLQSHSSLSFALLLIRPSLNDDADEMRSDDLKCCVLLHAGAAAYRLW